MHFIFLNPFFYVQLDAFIYQLFVSESSPEATHKYIFRPQRKLVKALQAYNF